MSSSFCLENYIKEDSIECHSEFHRRYWLRSENAQEVPVSFEEAPAQNRVTSSFQVMILEFL
jgi:hypothetical protein